MPTMNAYEFLYGHLRTGLQIVRSGGCKDVNKSVSDACGKIEAIMEELFWANVVE